MSISAANPAMPLVQDLSSYLPPAAVIAAQVRAALLEDVGRGDVTAALLPLDQRSHAVLTTREAATLSGSAWMEAVFRQMDPECELSWAAADGEQLRPGQVICQLQGRSRALLTGERTAMNFIQTLSGTATLARQFLEAVAGLPVSVLDTRKTLPGLRLAQKYAVRCGGCLNHRAGLYDAMLIKENHILAAGSVGAALAAARALDAGVSIEIEVESLSELQEALDAGATLILLDNFSLADLRRAVALTEGRAVLEASGGVNLTTVRAIAETGIDRVSVGALTKDVKAVDLSLRFTAV